LSTVCQVRAKVARSQPDVRPFSVSLFCDIGLGGVAVVVELSEDNTIFFDMTVALFVDDEDVSIESPRTKLFALRR
jgi:hypothetical protein